MTGAEKVAKIIQSGAAIDFQNIPAFDPNEIASLLKDRLVLTNGLHYAIAHHQDDPTDHSNRTEYFDWHSDGLYHSIPPRYVLLHCLNPGAGKVHTDLASVNTVLTELSSASYKTLQKLQSIYVGHNDGSVIPHPIISDEGMLLASRGYVSAIIPDVALEDHPSIRETSEALTELYKALDDNAATYQWHQGDTLIFDQRLYVHRRNSNTIDKDRKLIRMWFS